MDYGRPANWDRRAGLNLPAAACTYAESYRTQLRKEIFAACQSACRDVPREDNEGAPRQSLIWFDPRTVVACAISKINASSRQQIEVQELVDTLRDGKISLPQVDSFCTKVDLNVQKVFTFVLGIPKKDLCPRTARDLTEHTGEELPLLAT